MKVPVFLLRPIYFLSILLVAEGAQASLPPLNNGFYQYRANNRSAVFFINVFSHNELKIEQAWQAFNNAAFVLPKALEYARTYSIPLVIFIPDVFSSVSTLADNAPWLEGARVALAWASAYFRFKELGNVDVRIIKVNGPLESGKVVTTLKNIVCTPIDDIHKTPEENMRHRLFALEDFDTRIIDNAAFSCQPLVFDEDHNAVRVIKPQLLPLQKHQRRFVITGSAGFLGSHLARVLLQKGHQVIGLDNFLCSSTNNLEDLKQSPHFYFEQCDVTLPYEIEGPVDSVMHLASVPAPDFYYLLPIETLRTGLHGTREALELALRKKAQFLIASTSEVYGDPEVSPQPEHYCGRVSPIGKRSQYDMSKRGAETLIKLYFDTYYLDARIVRIFNTYGPGMAFDGRAVTNFIRAILFQKPMEIYGSGKQTRSFAYVSDTVDGIIKIVETNSITVQTPLIDRVFNIGNPEEFTIYELAHQVNTIAQQYSYKPVPIIEIPQFDFTDPKLRCPDITRATSLLGFHPKIKLAEGVTLTLKDLAHSLKKDS